MGALTPFKELLKGIYPKEGSPATKGKIKLKNGEYFECFPHCQLFIDN